ncbi:MAG: 50S ribosomal protein L18 [Candidatus Aenigmarchaeota archaeon]|nr:50S ribosomal protein L18 [Candidatus Aenigmarchaeota archaeon]
MRRRKEKKTNYKRRLKLLKSGKTRLVIRRYHNNFVIQFIGYNPTGDTTLLEVTSKELKNLGWNGHLGNISSGYLAGMIAGYKAKKKGIKDAVVDIGLQVNTKGNSIYAVVSGIIDSGIDVPADNKNFPDRNRLEGKHTKNKGDGFDEIKKKIAEMYGK